MPLWQSRGKFSDPDARRSCGSKLYLLVLPPTRCALCLGPGRRGQDCGAGSGAADPLWLRPEQRRVASYADRVVVLTDGQVAADRRVSGEDEVIGLMREL
jgi:hypothetical protein